VAIKHTFALSEAWTYEGRCLKDERLVGENKASIIVRGYLVREEMYW